MEVFDLEGASEYLKLAKSTLYKHLKTGDIPAFKVGRIWRFKKSVLEDWMKQRTKENASSIAKKQKKK